MGGARGTYGRQDRCIQERGGENREKDITWKAEGVDESKILTHSLPAI